MENEFLTFVAGIMEEDSVSMDLPYKEGKWDSLMMLTLVCVIGSYAIYVLKVDIYIMLILGLLGFTFDRLKYPAAPAVLGVILGKMLDSNLRRTLMASNGSMLGFVTRPIALIILVLILFSFLSQTGFYKKLYKKRKNNKYRVLRSKEK